MKRLRRVIYKGLVATSLVFFLAATALWVRSRHASDFMELTTTHGNHWVFYSTSKVGVQRFLGWPEGIGTRYRSFDPTDWSTLQDHSLTIEGNGSPRTGWDAWGVGIYSGTISVVVDAKGTALRVPPWPLGVLLPKDFSTPIAFWNVHAPHWTVAAFFLVFPLQILVRGLFLNSRARIRRHRNHCVTCAYDLRAASNRCPECGTCFQVLVKS